MEVIARYPTGSAYTCDPPVLTSDEDWLILVDVLPDISYMVREGWLPCLDGQYPEGADNWAAYRKGNINWMVTDDALWYVRSCAATELCRTMNLLGRDARVSIFSMVRDGDMVQWEAGGAVMPNSEEIVR